jgi:hypothetical protein
MQADPDAERGQRLAQLAQPGLDRLAAPELSAVFDIDAVGAGVLRDDEDFLDAGAGQVLGFGQHVADRARNQRAAQRRDDAEGAAMVAAFGNLQVGVVIRRQADALRRHQISVRVVRFGQVLVHVAHHFFHRVRTGNGQHRRVRRLDDVALGAEAAGDDDLAVLVECLADGVERFLDGGINEAAGVDDDQIGIIVIWGNFVTLGAQAGKDQFGVGTGFRAAQADKANGGHFR